MNSASTARVEIMFVTANGELIVVERARPLESSGTTVKVIAAPKSSETPAKNAGDSI
jgi:hypothetical protein